MYAELYMTVQRYKTKTKSINLFLSEKQEIYGAWKLTNVYEYEFHVFELYTRHNKYFLKMFCQCFQS